MIKENMVLVINPGSTSTKIAIYKGKECIAFENLSHDVEEIKKYKSIYQQKDMRIDIVLKWIKNQNISLSSLCAVVGRGGLLRPIPGGTYKITKQMLEDLKIGYQGQHASNLGGIIAYNIASKLNIPSFVVDPVSVDEFENVARISGMPDIMRKSLGHPLNIKAVTRNVCENLNKDFNHSSFVVAHIGGGISVAPVINGEIIDVNNGNEEGPFSPERTGGLPVGDLVKLAYSKKYTYAQFKKKLIGEGGFSAYLGTNNGKVLNKRIDEGDNKAKLILKAMAYQIGKEIGAMSTVLKGNVDGIILTGGMAHNKRLTDWIISMVSFIAPVSIVPGEKEMLALAEGVLRVMSKQEIPKIYEEEVQL